MHFLSVCSIDSTLYSTSGMCVYQWILLFICFIGLLAVRKRALLLFVGYCSTTIACSSHSSLSDCLHILYITPTTCTYTCPHSNTYAYIQTHKKKNRYMDVWYQERWKRRRARENWSFAQNISPVDCLLCVWHVHNATVWLVSVGWGRSRTR